MADDLLNEPAKAANAQAADQAEAGALAEAAIAASIAAATDSAVRERAGEVGAPDAVRDGDALASKRHPRLRGGSGEEPQPDDLQFWPAFVSSAGVIVATELGDKTFFIAAIMSMKHDRLAVFGGAILALILMTVLSGAIGYALPNILPRMYTHYAAVGLFVYFGLRLLWEWYELHKSGASGPSEELEEVEDELGFNKSDLEKGELVEAAGSTPTTSASSSSRQAWLKVASQAFTITFLAEWGDRSQIATIALSAAQHPIGVAVGGFLGHSVCTGLAVVGGRLLATRISEKTVTLVGGVLFLLFAVHALMEGP